MYDTTVTIVGNVVDAPDRRTLESGTTVATFRVASTARRFDKASGRWVDGDSLFLRVTCWRQLADNVKRSLLKGDPVMVTGRLFTRSYEVNGQRRSSFELEASAVGHDLTRGTTSFHRTRVESGPTYEVEGPPEETDLAPGDLPVGEEDESRVERVA
jgi:single-strand DNA-binding protein